ncbi:MAG: carbohydrate kinase [Bacteroidetes bacterium]|nr:carbohydrate kinase [Bacteroidota bacterium]MBS1973979.1 carbohydrate kinase [Bacteroidota bacterium]
MNFQKLFQQFTKIKVAVVGDVMLDTYWWGHVERISPEAPVPVVSFDRREHRIGGAANVALNAASLGAQVKVFSVIGDDDDGVLLQALISKNNIDPSCLLKSNARVTTNKMRVISRNQQMMRLDAETVKDLCAEDEKRLTDAVKKFVEKEKPEVVIFEDYNKGVLTENVINKIISVCQKNNVVTAVDPKRKNFFSYKGVDIFKPNLKEVKEGLSLLLDDIHLASLKNIHAQLFLKLHHNISFITLSEKGVFYQDGKKATIISSHLRNIADVSGAGDTVIAVASLVYAATKDVHLMAEVANIAGGLVCEEVGTVAINKERLINECKLLLA